MHGDITKVRQNNVNTLWILPFLFFLKIILCCTWMLSFFNFTIYIMFIRNILTIFIPNDQNIVHIINLEGK